MKFAYTPKDLERIHASPHLIGHMVGKTKLTDLHSEWIKYVWNATEHRSLQAHRGGYKTTACTEIGPMWWLLFHPSDRIAIARKPYTEAANTLRAISKYFETPEIQSLFQYAHGGKPSFTQRKESSVTFNFKKTVTREGSIDAFGIDSSFTGRHYDKIICDDFVILKDRISKAERLKTTEAIREIITNIIDPGKQCGFIGTPWHKDDAWAVCPTPILYPWKTTGILTEAQIEEKRDTTTQSLFAANYELQHLSDEGAPFKDPIWERWSCSAPSRVYGHIDAKYEGDHTGAITFAAKIPKSNIIQITGRIFHNHVKEEIKWLVKQIKQYRCAKVFVEKNADHGYTADLLTAEGIRVQKYHEKANKHIKIISYLKDFWKELTWDTDMDGYYMDQILDYRKGQLPDDAPDSAASLLREAFYSSAKDKALWEM